MYESKPPLHPTCIFCRWQKICADSGRSVKSVVGGCFEADRLPTVEGMRALSRWWDKGDGEVVSPPLQVMDRLLERFERDRQRYARIFEPSVSLDVDGWHLFRFSYSFPGFYRDAEATRDFICSLWDPYGTDLRKEFRDLLNYTLDASVEQVIVGLADDGDGRWRAKLYLQFFDDGSSAAWDVARSISGNPEIDGICRWDGLHMLGIDLGPRGVCGLKWYVRKKEAYLDARGAPWESSALLSVIRRRGVRILRNLLVIHRESDKHDSSLAVPRELDFALSENGLLLASFSRTKVLRPLLRPGTPFREMCTEFRIAPVRLSVPLDSHDKVNLYYLLIE